MALTEFVAALMPLFSSPLAVALATAAVSSALGSYFALRTLRLQSRELIDASIAWQWVNGPNGKMDEEPFLVVQNRSANPAFLVRARWLRGTMLRVESTAYAFSYVEPTDGSFPLEVRAQGVTSFPLSMGRADQIARRSWWYSRAISYLFKRSYLWIEVTTITGARLTVAANDATSFQKRPLWLSGRWLPRGKPDWTFNV
ncbi:hypothetical protein [Sphingomonas sp. G-3-2-10]|uniref:hypothetical protein n=1 Tax=Sphingomonas sp. G-3-2-10 TaxID=2728838 RepID=UPI00146BAAF6|nr:hypothetical protein [Sphingomonas sp. G-3-2-10]NML04289.1 hypothetical protein [Sphingomonas sp. G-3-2-10]